MGAGKLFVALVGLSAVALLVGCTPAGGAAAPDDLLISYAWREGSLPPPYHYEYSIRLQADGTGEVTMVPNYPGEGVPVWTEPFTVARADLDRLYATMLARGLLSEAWSEPGGPPLVGGSTEHMSVVAEGRVVEIPASLAPAQQGRATAIYAALREVVPTAIFEDLEARRAAYEAAYDGP